MVRVKIFRVFSVIDGYTIRRVHSEAEAQRLCAKCEEYDYEVLVEYW